MIERMMIAAIAVCLGACASSGPEAPPADVDAAASAAPAAVPEGEIYDLDAPNVETTASVATKSDEDEVVCRRERLTGSKMSHRVCRRRSDIEAASDDSQDALRKMRDTGSQLESGVSN